MLIIPKLTYKGTVSPLRVLGVFKEKKMMINVYIEEKSW